MTPLARDAIKARLASCRSVSEAKRHLFRAKVPTPDVLRLDEFRLNVVMALVAEDDDEERTDEEVVARVRELVASERLLREESDLELAQALRERDEAHGRLKAARADYSALSAKLANVEADLRMTRSDLRGTIDSGKFVGEQLIAERNAALRVRDTLRDALVAFLQGYDDGHPGYQIGRTQANDLRAALAAELQEAPRSWSLPTIPTDVRRVTNGRNTFRRDPHRPDRWWVDGGGQKDVASMGVGMLLELSVAGEITEVTE